LRSSIIPAGSLLVSTADRATRVASMFAVIGLVGILVVAPAQGKAQGTKADYERADALAAKTGGKVFKSRVQPHWLGGNERFWYRNDLAEGAREFILVDPVKGTRQPAFDHAKVAEALSKATGKPQKAANLPIERMVIPRDGAIHFEAAGKSWRYDAATGTL